MKKLIWKKICTTEKIRNNARIIKAALAGTTPRYGLNHVIGPTPSELTQWMESKTKTELETLCLAEAGRQFTQVATNPFLQTPLIELLTKANLVTKAFDQVLAGTFECPEGVDKMTECLLSALQHPPRMKIIQLWQLGDITTGWHKAREATSSSPSSIHFGHYMVGTFNLTIAVFVAWLANLGFTTGYMLKRWHTSSNIMLEKQAGNFNIEKLQIILLFEGDFNQNNKWLGCMVMFHAKEHQQMAKEQDSSQKEKSASIQCQQMATI